MLPVLSCPWRTSLCVVFVAELSYHSLVLFFRSGVTYVLYLNRRGNFLLGEPARKALWLPVRAKPYLAQKTIPFLRLYLQHPFSGYTRGLSDRPLDPFGVPSDDRCPNNKQRKNLLIKIPQALGLGVMGQGSKTLAGVSGAAPPIGVQGQSPCRGAGQSPASRVQRAQPFGGGDGGNAPIKGCRGRSP